MYKEILLEYENKLDDKDLLAIRLFNESFEESEIKLQYDGNRIIALLRMIEIDKLKNISNQFSSYTNKTIFKDLVHSIENIKSYGIKGKKRNYVDYNKERKVKNRKEKEKKRKEKKRKEKKRKEKKSILLCTKECLLKKNE